VEGGVADQAAAPAPEKAGLPVEYGVRRVPRVKPHQLRHSYPAAVRRAHGMEAARVVLGHTSIEMTELYAERDLQVGVNVARLLG